MATSKNFKCGCAKFAGRNVVLDIFILPTESKKYATATCQVWFKIIRNDPKLSGHILVSLAESKMKTGTGRIGHH